MAELSSNHMFALGSPDSDMQMHRRLAKWYSEAEAVAASDPRLASSMEKVKQGIEEAHNALLVTLPKPIGVSHRLMPRLEIHIPMPAGVAVPASSTPSFAAPNSPKSAPSGATSDASASQAKQHSEASSGAASATKPSVVAAKESSATALTEAR
jgi:hypothetical protein